MMRIISLEIQNNNGVFFNSLVYLKGSQSKSENLRKLLSAVKLCFDFC